MIGFVVMAAGYVLGAFTDLSTGYGYTAIWFVVVGFGLGCSMPQAMNAALGVLDPERAGTGSGLLQAFRQVGGTVGVAVLGTVLNSVYRNNVDTTGLPAQAAEAVERGVGGGLAVAAKTGSTRVAEQCPGRVHDQPQHHHVGIGGHRRRRRGAGGDADAETGREAVSGRPGRRPGTGRLKAAAPAPDGVSGRCCSGVS